MSLPGSRAPGFGDDFPRVYNTDKPRGHELEEDTRVWDIYLDQAKKYDADMIQGFRNIIDDLLVFAPLFSAVVATFAARTSQTLQPDNTQILASLLLENSQLFRTAGNSIVMDTVSAAIRGSRRTSADLWVNGLFITSLTLSLSTALLTILAKQWIQAYTATVPGDAKTRALVHQFRLQGLIKWRLGDIIESLPLILHFSIGIFLIGLVLYIYQLLT
ncbi:hypothetical protein C0989_002879 [Termitomyces sp. Mn162]|nr:hypothetical protein C0989_002879 [Termitomyces sp. Mn162]